MRTYEAYQRDLDSSRYQSEIHDPLTKEGAKNILAIKEGKARAKRASQELWKQYNEPGQGYLPTARLSAPLNVLRAMQTLGVIEEANDDRGRAIRFRLTRAGAAAAAKAGASQNG